MRLFNWSITRDVFSLLPKGTPRNLALLLVVQISVSALDVLAILLLGVTSKLGFDYAQNNTSEFPNTLTKLLRIDNLDFQAQLGVMSCTIVILFIARTTISIYSNRRIFLYLGNQAGFASKKFIEMMFRSKPQNVISRNSQEFLYGITSGIDNLTLNFLGATAILLTESIFLFAILFVVVAVQPLTGIIAVLIFTSAAILIHKLTSKKARTDASKYADLNILYSRRLLDTLLVYRELFLRQKEIEVTKEVQIARSESLIIRANLLLLPTLSKYLFELTLILGGTLIAMTQLVISDIFSAAASVAIFIASASRILPSIIRAQGALLSIRQSEGASEVTIRQLRELEEKENQPGQSQKSSKRNTEFIPSINIDDLNFAYEEVSGFSIKDVEIRITAGQFVAIVGESGSGKTTLIDLILGMLTPTSGTIEISCRPALEAINEWPGKIAYVPQDIAIVEGTIRKNITLNDTIDVSNTEIFAALDKARLKNDVLDLPNGLDELVGERGIKLSGGQRQRLGIARALFTKPEMIVFDEATSSLDPLTEKTVTEAIYRKQGNVTLIVVAHRLSTVKNADLVILMDKGEIVAQGTFEEVRRISPKFDQQAKLVNL